MDIRYLKLLLRTTYFQRALRAITTGHSNRRRTQEADFKALRVFLPSFEVQTHIVGVISKVEDELSMKRGELSSKIAALDEILMSHISPEQLRELLG